MKTKLPLALLAVFSAAALSAQPPPQATARRETRLVSSEPRPPGPLEPMTFLGVETAPVSPTLTEQLSLPKGVGLVVRSVVPDSPAANSLKPHDILTKLNDQLLIETRQLAVLVQSYKEGDEVTLTYVRGGKESSVKVKLTKREMPRLMSLRTDARYRVFDDDHDEFPPGAPNAPRTIDFLRSAQGGRAMTIRSMHAPHPGEMAEGASVNLENSHLLFSDDQGSLDITVKDGKKTLVAKSPKGDSIFEGPVDTPEQRKALPPAVRERLDRLEKMDRISFTPAPGAIFHAETVPPPAL